MNYRASTLLACVSLAIGVVSSSVLAQNGGAPGRRETNGSTTVLAFNDVVVEELVPFIVETTGKVVIPAR